MINQKYVNLVKDTNITAEEAIERFDLNLARLKEEGADKTRDEDEKATLDVLSKWLEDAIQLGAEMSDLQSRAQALAQFAHECGCTQSEIKELLTMRPKQEVDPWQ